LERSEGSYAILIAIISWVLNFRPDNSDHQEFKGLLIPLLYHCLFPQDPGTLFSKV
jgi:hypothetical protein